MPCCATCSPGLLVTQPYDEVMEAWRTSCPRLTVWEDAVDRSFVQHARSNGVSLVRVTRRPSLPGTPELIASGPEAEQVRRRSGLRPP